jgi:alpha-L-fucosidase
MTPDSPLKGAELASMLKSSIQLKRSDGLTVPGLRLSEQEMQWWQDAKFGLFIHWGLYSLLGRGEWVMYNEQIPPAEYAKLADQFNPRGFDADAWAALAKEAGMKYSVMVARHHDGFALWDSPASYGQFTSVKHAANRDFVREYVDAFRSAGFPTGLYYSPMDWRFPGYFRPKEESESAQQMKAQCYGQVEELMNRYGPIAVLWYDGAWLAHQGSDAQAAWLWDPITLNQMVRRYQPGIVINERSGWEGDIETDEGPHALTGPIMPIPWEKTFTLLHGWGYNADGYVMPYEEVMPLLINAWVRGGNVLLNVGPDPDGVISQGQVAVLQKIGAFLRSNGAAIYGTRAGPFQPVDGVYGATYKDSTIYLHVFDGAAFNQQLLPALPAAIRACRILAGQPLSFHQDAQGLRVELPESLWQPIDTIIQLDMD